MLLLQSSVSDLPVCSQNGVCAVVDTYGTPWSEHKCRCQDHNSRCNANIAHHRDGRTVVDKTKQYKVLIDINA